MRSIIIQTVMLIAVNSIHSYGQLHFTISNTQPCLGEPITFSLPVIAGCPTAKVLSESSWNILPRPARDEITYTYTPTRNGITAITLRYKTYQPSVSVSANYSCDRVAGGTVSDIITIRPPVVSLVATSTTAGPLAPGTVVRYRLKICGAVSPVYTQLVSTLNSATTEMLATDNNIAVEWSAQWQKNGTIAVRYIVTDGVTRWTGMTTPVAVDVLKVDRLNSNENYVLTNEPSDENGTNVTKMIQYYDGLGRPVQKISVSNTPSFADLVYPTVYDQYGRETRKYLPFGSADGNGNFQINALTSQASFYQTTDGTVASDPKPFSETVFDGSPLDLVMKQGSPGLAWQPNSANPDLEHVIQYQYRLNTPADSIVRFSYDTKTEDVSLALQSSPFYSPGFLYCKKKVDEDRNDVLEFTDKLNRLVCKKVFAGRGMYACTYYVYDDVGNLMLVIPPEGARTIKSLLLP